ncbi:MAG TPA: DUF4384 domain-containing protein [Myxococcota bacterium]
MIITSLIAVALSIGSAAPKPWTCDGNVVPPVDYDALGRPITVEHAEAVELKSRATREQVKRQAERKLVAQLCRIDDETICGALAAHVRAWTTGENATEVCAMATVTSSAVETWRTQLVPDLDGELRTALLTLMPDDAPSTVKIRIGAKKRRAAVVVLDNVDDSGGPGGLRVNWLLGRVRGVLTKLDIDMLEKPKNWDGRLPAGVEYLLRGSLVDRVDPKTQLAVMDISFSVVNKRGFSRSAAPFSIPAALAPPAPQKLTPPAPLVGLSLHVSTAREGGSVCPGDYAQVYVTNDTDVPLYVRVIDIDSSGNALVLFPNEVTIDDVVPPGKTVPLSPDGFTIEGAAHMREQYIAIGATTPEALGRWAETRGTCRFNADDAAFLKKGQKVEAPYRAVSGFTMLDGVRCNKVMALPDPQLAVQALSSLPLCPRLDR